MKSMNRMFVFAVLMMILGSAAYAEDAATGTAGAKSGMDPAMMAKMKALTSPGEAHKVLEPFVGKWNYTGKFWMTPDAPAQDMTGATKNSMIFGGRFLKQKIEGPWMGEKFEGLGFTGYDNIRGEYSTVWIDSMGTGMMTVTGQFDAAAKTLNQAGANSCPLTGEKARPGRSTWTVVDADHNTYTSYMNGPDGKEFKMMEINYTRAAADKV